MKLRGISASILLVSLGLVARATTVNTPQTVEPTPWNQWRQVADAGYESEALDAVHQRADELESAAVMAVYRGRVVVAWGDVERKLELHSVRKSLYAALWGIATERGLVRLESTLAELGVDDLRGLSAEEKRARMEHLLESRSGVYHPAAYTSSENDAARPQPGSHSPGRHWYYNNWDFNVAGALLERVTGKALGALFDEWIAEPLGMEDFEPGDVFEVLEPGRSRWPALTFRMSTRDLARFGQMWLDRGSWGGRQVVPAAWVDRASRPASELGGGVGYGWMWWTYEPHPSRLDRYPQAGKYPSVQAQGTGGQAVFVIPDRELVIVHRGDTDHGRRVPGGEVWSLVDGILEAGGGEPSSASRPVPMVSRPFESQAEAWHWPEPRELAPEELRPLLGGYEFGPGTVATVFVHEGRLFASMPGMGEAELFARSESEFFLRVDPAAAAVFRRDASGSATEVQVTIRGRELVGRAVGSSAENTHEQPVGFAFTLPDLEGNAVSTSDPRFRGKVVLVDLWGTWCPPCRSMTPFLNRLHDRYSASGLEIVGAAFERSGTADPAEPVRQYVAEHGIEYLTLYGGDAEYPTDLVFEKLPLEEFDGFPTVVLLARDGAVRTIQQGFDPGIEERIESLVQELIAAD